MRNCRKRFWARRGLLFLSHNNVGQPLQEMTLQILKNAIGVFDKFNHIRNNQTLAHDNDLLHKAEARFIFDSVSAVLRFIKSVDTATFEDWAGMWIASLGCGHPGKIP
jgi:hypothetical protein